MGTGFRRPLRVSGLLLGHGCVAAVWIFVFWFLEREIVFLWGGDTPLIFGVLPLEYLFQVLDVSVLTVLLYSGAASAIQELRDD
jgi:hypothetical protein